MNRSKLIALAMMLVFLATMPGITKADETLVTPNKLVVFKIGDYNYYTQDIGSSQVNKVKMDAAPLIKENRTFVPVRYLGNALGVNDSNIKWGNTTKTATLNGKAELKLTIGQKAVITNGKREAIDVAPYIIPPGRTMLPARYVAEGLGFKVEWDATNKIAICYPAGTEKPDLTAVLKEITAKPIVVRPKAELDNQGWLCDKQAQYFRAELEKTVVMDKKNGTLSFYLPVLPEGFVWDIGLNAVYGPKVQDYKCILDGPLPDGKSYTYKYNYSTIDRGYLQWGTAKESMGRSSDWTTLELKTDQKTYHNYGY